MTNAIDTSRMSAGKRAAFELTEAARETGWRYPTFAGGLFVGRLSTGIVRPYPDSGIEPEGEAFLERLESYLLEEVDADAIDRTGEIPDRVFRDLAAMGAFGIKIPKRYGGLGLSQREAVRNAEAIIQRSTILDENRNVPVRLLDIARQATCAGKQLHDANVVATMQEHGLTRLVTGNPGDFRRFEGIDLVDLAELSMSEA